MLRALVHRCSILSPFFYIIQLHSEEMHHFITIQHTITITERVHVFLVWERKLPNHFSFLSKAPTVSLQGEHRRKIIAIYAASSCSKYKGNKTAPFTLHLLSLSTTSGKRSKSVVTSERKFLGWRRGGMCDNALGRSSAGIAIGGRPLRTLLAPLQEEVIPPLLGPSDSPECARKQPRVRGSGRERARRWH